VKDLSIRSELQTPSGGDPAPEIGADRSLFGRFGPIAAAAGLFVLLGLTLIPYVGIQDDEVIFANPLYLPTAKAFAIELFHRQVALMVLSYLGTLKTLVFIPLLAAFGANIWSLRLPAAVLGAVTVWMFYKLAVRSAGRKVAIVGTFLLASDSSFLVTNTIDWGPVALQHFLLVTGCFFLLKFAQESGPRNLAVGFFLFGLALWDKAIFVWAIAGLSCGAVAVFSRHIRGALRPANVVIACAAFVIGALPFLIYNLREPNATIKSDARFEFNMFSAKFEILRATLDGSVFFGFMSGSDLEPDPKGAASLRGKAATWIAGHTGSIRHSGMLYGIALPLLLVPWWWKYPAARFSLVFMCVTWLAMAVTREAGASVHHAVLLWPFPQLFVATVLAALPWRKLAEIVACLLVVINLLVIVQLVADFERNGARGNFTDASLALSSEFSDSNKPVVVLDWGILNGLAFLHQGHLQLRSGGGPFQTDSPTSDERASMDWLLSDPQSIFVTHVAGRETWPDVRPRLNRVVAERGIRKEMIKIIPDSNGRPVFELFRLLK
jgi:hypothetical protein